MAVYRVILDVYTEPFPVTNTGGRFIALHVEGSTLRRVRAAFKGQPVVTYRGRTYDHYRVISVRRINGADILDRPVPVKAFII